MIEYDSKQTSESAAVTLFDPALFVCARCRGAAADAGRRSTPPGNPDHVTASRLANDDKVADLELGITLNTLLVYSIVTCVSLGPLF